MITRDAIVAEARTWIGTRWKHQACKRGVGVDCIGLIGGVALALGLTGAEEWRDDPSLHQYGPQPDPKMLLQSCARFMEQIPLRGARPGDVLVMRFKRDPQHFAFVTSLDPFSILHAAIEPKRVTEHRLSDDDYKSKVMFAFRLRGIA